MSGTRSLAPMSSRAPIDRDAAPAGAPARRRELRARGRRTLRRLLDAGTEVFERRGYHAARVDDVVQVAETSHGTFYLYFSGKDDLFRTLAAEVVDAFTEHAERLGPLTPDSEGLDALRDWLDGFDRLYTANGAVIRAWTEAESSSELEGLGEGVLGSFTAALASRIADTGTQELDADVAALAIVAMVERFSYYRLTGRVRLSASASVDALTRVTFAALFGGPTPRGRRTGS